MKMALILLSFVLMIGLASAQIEILNKSIPSEFFQGAKVGGKINAIFTNHNSNELLSSNFEGNITAVEFLKKLDEELIETYDHEWVNEGFQNPQQTFQFYEKGKRMLTEYFEFSLQRKAEIVAVEKEFQYRVGPYILRGIIDRIDRLPDGAYEIIDYKTHAELWDQSRIDSDLQLTLYSLGAKNALNIEPVTFSYFFLAHNKLMPTQRTKAQRQEALKQLKNVSIKIKKQEFSPNTAQCHKCDFKQSCKYSTAKAIASNAK